MTEQEKYMKAALKLAQKGGGRGRSAGRRGWLSATAKLSDADANRRETKKTHLHHAEIEATEKACKSWRLAAAPLRSVRYARAVPDVRRRAHQLAHENRVLRCARPEGRLVRLADKSVRTAV